ncbi:hypothetical protein B0H13DRAFT_2327020 [Mycena leptocephala]|nr:hypothetical protein B0H13DRAFT_2327020 [Mycena leptocephala]
MAIQIQVNAMDADWILLSNASLTAAALTNAPFDFSAALALNASATGEEYLSCAAEIRSVLATLCDN